jgi:uncharacterized protein YjdB
MKKKLSFIILFILPVITALAATVNFDLSNTSTYSLTSNLTASYDGSTGTLWLTHSNDGQPGVFTLEAVADVATFSSFTFGYNQTGQNGKVIYQAGDGTRYYPYNTVTSTAITIPGAGSPASTIGSGKFTITIQSGLTMQEGYSGHVGIYNFSGMEKEILPEGYVSIGDLPFYSGVDSDGNPIATTAAVAASAQTKGNATLAGSGTDAVTTYYDLENYTDIQIKLTCAEEHIGKAVSLRYFFIKADATTPSSIITKNGIFETNTLTIDLDVDNEYANNNIGTRKLIGIKTQGSWSTVIPEDFPFNISYVMVKGIPVSVESIVLNKATTKIEIGSTQELIYTINPANATNKKVVWESDNETVASVVNGVVTANSIGTATITVRTEDGGYEATCGVTVTPPAVPATGISLNKDEIELNVGDGEQLIFTITPSDATNQDVIWNSTNEAVATVDKGLVTAIGQGTAYIVVTTTDIGENYVATCKVTVLDNGTGIPVVTGNAITVVSEEYYTIMGSKVSSDSRRLKGLYIVRYIMSDGSAKSKKIYIK